jgi:hypothetical protein
VGAQPAAPDATRKIRPRPKRRAPPPRSTDPAGDEFGLP